MTAARADRVLRNRDPAPPLALYLRRTLVQTVESYCQNGRKLAELDGAALREEFLRVFDAWAAAAPDSALGVNHVSAEFMMRRKPAPIDEIADRLSWVFVCHDSPNLAREPVVVIALGRWLYAPFRGELLTARPEPDEAALGRDFDAMMKAAAARRVR